MSYRVLPPPDDPEKVRAWMQEVSDAISALERQQPVFGPAVQIGDVLLTTITIGLSVHLYATNTLTGATALIV